jgi:hypothetical protein
MACELTDAGHSHGRREAEWIEHGQTAGPNLGPNLREPETT